MLRFNVWTGRAERQQPTGGWPEIGSYVAKLQGATQPAIPPFVGLSPKMQHRPYKQWATGFLGPAFAPFQPNGEGKGDLTLNGITLERLSVRRLLNQALDRLHSDLDQTGMMAGLDAFQRQALGVLTSSRLAEALDISRVSPRN